LKLHLPATFVSTTLLTRGFFLILFEDEKGATSTKKLASVEWNGLSLSFSRYNPNFDSNAQRVDALFTHMIKVQFLDLHDQFRNERALTIMASKLGDVLDIEAADSYMKRPAGPMVTIEVKDIAKLVGYIKIPSMAEGASTTDMIRQKILYSGLPNQCWKCRRFGHQARTCNTIKNKAQEGVVHHNPLPSTSDDRQPSTRPAHTNATRTRAQDPTSTKTHNSQALGRYQGHTEVKVLRNRTSAPPLPIDPPRNLSGNQTSVPGQWSATAGGQEDLSMTEPPPPTRRAKGETRADVGKPPKEATTPKNKLIFELPELNCPQTQKLEANANPFANSKEGNQGVNLRARLQEDTLEGWSFQGRRKHAPKLASPRPKLHHTLLRTSQQKTAGREKNAASLRGTPLLLLLSRHVNSN
jgi:hypothetical protein